IREHREDVLSGAARRVIAEVPGPPPARGRGLVAVPRDLSQLQGQRRGRILLERLTVTVRRQGEVPTAMGLIPLALEPLRDQWVAPGFRDLLLPQRAIQLVEHPVAPSEITRWGRLIPARPDVVAHEPQDHE